MNNLTIIRLWRTGFIDLHIDLFDLSTGYSFEVVLSFIKFAEREKAFDIVWNEHDKVQSLVEWFTLFRSIKSLKGAYNYDTTKNQQ